jgi:hypothetical protein
VGDFRGFVHGLVSAARRLLFEELLFTSKPESPAPAIPWATMRDDPTQGKSGWNFLQDSRIQWPVDGAQWLMGRVQAEPGI